MKQLKVTIKQRVAAHPTSILEQALITEFLLAKGYLRSELKDLPDQEARLLMIEACRHAALRLAEIEARAQFRRKIKLPD